MAQSHDHPASLPFLKMNGLGNDFVILDARTRDIEMTPAWARAIGHRNFGVGYDQLVTIHEDESAEARLIFWNSDGSTAAACGNATRCVASLIMSETDRNQITLRTERGLLACEDAGQGLIRVNMGVPILDWQDIPLAQDVDTVNLPLEGAPATCSMGNPHCTFFVENADFDIAPRGAEVEHDPLFPERTNVQFVQVLARDRARVRVWERGVGVTLASGSSSCAVVVNGVRKGLLDRRATLELDGGEIEIDWREDGVWMTGPVATAFTGTLSPDLHP